jgi:hypothetical protein
VRKADHEVSLREKERQMNERDWKRRQRVWGPCPPTDQETFAWARCVHEAALAGDTDAMDALLDEMHAISELRKTRVLPRNQD